VDGLLIMYLGSSKKEEDDGNVEQLEDENKVFSKQFARNQLLIYPI
jgi:hypothetical protein